MLKRISAFIVFSILFHLGFLTIVHFTQTKTRLAQNTVTVEYLTPQEIIKKFEDPEKRQIVEQSEEAVNDETPDNAKFMSLHNQRVIKETKAQNHGKFRNERASQASQQQPKLISLTPDYDWHKISQKNNSPRAPAATDDYLENINEGEETLLSTREFIYYTYYQRIKNQLSQYWEPKIKEKVMRLFTQGRNIAATGDKITKIIITLDARGILIKVQVLEQSGVKDLDDAAVEAFRAAAPFPNPPKGIADRDGTIKIRWDFVLEV
ncbi:MAG: energy transducer TonB [Pseudomonadota bacterium]|mgnify:CR=1 FL=1|nr:energy transducer TonB [Pseudomonadota bacterium]